MVIGSRFDTRSNLPWTLGSWTTEGIVRGGMKDKESVEFENEGTILCGVNVVRSAFEVLRGMTNGYPRWWGDAIRRKVRLP